MIADITLVPIFFIPSLLSGLITFLSTSIVVITIKPIGTINLIIYIINLYNIYTTKGIIMNAISIVMFVFGGIALLIGLLLSGSGTGAGLNAQAGQDLELFKKTKDRGFVKILQIIMFLVTLILLALGIALFFIK